MSLWALISPKLWADGLPQTTLKAADLDAAACGEWVEKQVPPVPPAGLPKDGPRHIIWTADSRPEFGGAKFGDAAVPGARHLRIGLKAAIPVGSVMVRGGGQLSVLREDVPYPGDLAKESDWLPAERLKGSEVTRAEVLPGEFAIWTLPPGTKTRALRFTHTAQAADPKYEGWLGGAILLSERLANIAPQAVLTASAREEAAGTITDGLDPQWQPWDNGKDGAAQAVSPAHPEWLLLSWPKPVPLTGLTALWAGFGAADVQVYTGPAAQSPQEASETQWRTLKAYSKLENGYPLTFWPNALEFGQTITTRAVRLRMTAATAESHPHLQGNTKDGHRVWLGELFALQPLGQATLKSALPAVAAELPPPIPIRFRLAEAGYVTLVIEDAAGHRVRNLISETRFPAGDNVAWWDGTDDRGRDRDAARHGLYHIPEQPVAPGQYRVRGLVHGGVELKYELSVYNAGNPGWETADTTGGWLTNHTPPQAALFVPADHSPTRQPMIYLGSAVSEGGSGLAWVNLDGKKLGGRGWIGGNWTAAATLARDEGPRAVPELFAYVGATWTRSANNEDRTQGELRLTALTSKGDRALLKYPFTPPPASNGKSGDADWTGHLGGIAVRDGLLVASLRRVGSLVFVDAREASLRATAPMDDPRGLAFDAEGRLLVLSGTQLLRFPKDLALVPGERPSALPAPEILVRDLKDPAGLTLDKAGRIFVSDQGDAQQVKIFSPEGKLLGAIGRAGAPQAGPYDPLHMNHPHGLAIDERQQLWVAENDFQPKRVSVWTLDGKFVRAFYGPGRYGGGGTLDPRDRTRFYYDGLEFKLDWETGATVPIAVLNRSDARDPQGPPAGGAPETPFYVGGRQYLTNCFNSNPTGGAAVATIWRVQSSRATPVAALGRASDWPLLTGADFKSRWPEGLDPNGESSRNAALFAWSDENGDGRAQPAEVAMRKGVTGGVTVGPDLAFLESRVDGQALRFVPKRFTAQGAPVYDLSAGEVLVRGAQAPTSSGGDQTLTAPGGWTIQTTAPQPWAPEGLGGVKNGEPLWSYPSLWPGLHASHEAPVADRPGEVIGSTRLLGGTVTPLRGEAGPLWAVNGNMGNIYLFTVDGLFVAQLFQDVRTGQPWTMPQASRGVRLNELSLHDENFFPTINQTSDGAVYLCDGARTSLVRVEGLEKIRRLPASELVVTPQDLTRAAAWRVQAEVRRQAERGSSTLNVALRQKAPVVDGQLEDWAGADWAVIDRRGTGANFDSDSKPYDVSGAVMIAGDRLYAAFRTQDAELLKNSGETPNAPFKTGGALDLMLGSNPGADPKRAQAVVGDERLLITQVKGKTLALLYRAVVPGTREPVPFSSPWRTITLDRVEDLSAQVVLAQSQQLDERGKVKNAFYEFSVPLAALGLKPVDGQAIKADLGLLRGNGFQTVQRVYWNNKATAITADVPSEAELTPALWGKWLFKAAP